MLFTWRSTIDGRGASVIGVIPVTRWRPHVHGVHASDHLLVLRVVGLIPLLGVGAGVGVVVVSRGLVGSLVGRVRLLGRVPTPPVAIVRAGAVVIGGPGV